MRLRNKYPAVNVGSNGGQKLNHNHRVHCRHVSTCVHLSAAVYSVAFGFILLKHN